MPVTIYHNPRCSKSRETLQLLQNRKIQLEVVEYLETPPDFDQLVRILDLLGVEETGRPDRRRAGGCRSGGGATAAVR